MERGVVPDPGAQDGPGRAEAGAPTMARLRGLTGFMVRIVQLRLFRRYYEELGDHGISPGGMSALLAIRDNPGIRHGLLAECMEVRGPNMTKLVQGLERHGLVARKVSKQDRRAPGLYLTAKGRAKIDALAPLALAHDSSTTAALSSAERRELLRLLNKLADGLAATSAERRAPP